MGTNPNVRFGSKADIGTQSRNVRFVPKADIRFLFDHVVSASRKCRWDFQSECFSGLQVDDELEVGGLRHR